MAEWSDFESWNCRLVAEGSEWVGLGPSDADGVTEDIANPRLVEADLDNAGRIEYESRSLRAAYQPPRYLSAVCDQHAAAGAQVLGQAGPAAARDAAASDAAAIEDAAIEDAIEALAENPRPPDCTPLRGYSGVWRIRLGGYRACYAIDDGRLLILVVTISTRDEVYAVVQRHLRR